MSAVRGGMILKSRVHPTYKTHYRLGNWRVYERRVENAVICYKSIIGDGLRARSVSAVMSRRALRAAILNQMTAVGRPESHVLSP